MRVLVPLLQASSGNDPFFYLIDRLRSEMEFVILTADRQVVQQAAERQVESLFLESPPLWIPAWHQTRLGRQVFGFWDEYRARRRSIKQADDAIKKTKPDAVLLSGDFKGILYSLCQHQELNSVVLQITLDWVNLDSQLQDFRGRQGRKGERLIKLLALLSAITRRRWMGQVRGEPYLMYGNDLGRTAGAVLAGVRFGVPLKGGMGARYVCVNGEHFREMSIEAGIPAERIVVTGSPEHDRMAAFKAALTPAAAEQLRTELKIPPQSPIITLFAQPITREILPGVDYAAELDWIVRQLVNLSEDATVVVKLHPAQQIEPYSYLSQLPQVCVAAIKSEEFNNRLIYASRFVITRTSTIGYNAFALDVPLLTYGFYDLWGERYFEDIGGSWHVKSKPDFLAAAKRLLLDEAQRAQIIASQQRVRQRHMLLDGKCCQRIGEVLCRS